jgi:predicted transcriptional regulator with HTH domain
MYYLYYDNTEKHLIIVSEKRNARGLELLETNHTIESIFVRTDAYKKIYKCDVVNECQVDNRVVSRIRRKNVKFRHTEETKKKISKSVSGKVNGRYGAVDPEHIRLSKSEKLKFYYKYNIHGKKGYVDSEETRKQKSINNNNKGGWFWIHNRTTGEEKRCYGDIPEGFRRGRLYNPFQ